MFLFPRTRSVSSALNPNSTLSASSNLPLSKLVPLLSEKLKELHQREWSDETISTKLKLLAERKPFLYNIAALKTNVNKIYEDETACRVWRWEILILEILPSEVLSKVKKARQARRRFLSHYMAIQKLVDTVDSADAKILDPKSKGLDRILAQIVKFEEKVIDNDRRVEKERLKQQAKRKQQQEAEEKRRAKELAEEEKRREKERKQEQEKERKLEKERMRKEAAEARESEKQKKAEERKQQEEQKKLKEDKKLKTLNKQKASFVSFFANSKSGAKTAASETKTAKSPQKQARDASDETSFDADAFRKAWNTQDASTASAHPFAKLSESAKQSRKRRTRQSLLMAGLNSRMISPKRWPLAHRQ